jgi:Ca2+-binding RTX toxin-like protein
MNLRARLVVVLFVLAAPLAVAAPAGAVLPGTNGRVVFTGGPGFGNAKLFLRTTTNSVGGGAISGPLNTGLTLQHRHPAWSPDRTKIVFAHGAAAGPYDLYTLDLTTPGATAQNITNTPAVSEDRPAWSPDGARIAYDGGDDIFVRTPAGPGPGVNMTSTIAAKAYKAAWTPDAQTLYYGVGNPAVAPNGNTNDVKLFRQPANNSSAGTQFHHVSGAHVAQPTISPDGTKICYGLQGPPPGNTPGRIVVAAPINAPGSITQVGNSGEGDYNCTWSPDGTKLAFAENYGNNASVFMRNSNGTGTFINITNVAGQFEGNPDWAPDARPECPDSTVSTTVGTPLTFTPACVDTGPAYERTTPREGKDSDPTNGTLTQAGGLGQPFTYTPNPGFVGTDSFQIKAADDFGFGNGVADRGTVTITVKRKPTPGGGEVFDGTAGNDTINGTPGPDVINCGAGDDVVNGNGGDDVINCGDGNDRVNGDAGNDQVNGEGGVDQVNGNDGDDQVNGGDGADVAAGGSGNDRVSGGNDGDRVNGNAGNDRLGGDSGRDRLNGDAGRDRVSGGSSNDRVSGGSSNDRVAGDSGNDRANGDSGNDRVNGGRGNDRVSGGRGNDRVSGSSGNDRVSGDSGRDRVSGDSGRDRLNGGRGRDRCDGGRGRDRARSCERRRRIP